MNSLLIVFASLFFVSAFISVFFIFAKSKLTKQVAEANNKILVLENKYAALEINYKQGAKKTAVQVVEKAVTLNPKNKDEHHTHAIELVTLRKEHAATKDELNKIKLEFKRKEQDLRNAKEQENNKLYVIQEENKRLLEMLKEQDNKIAEVKNENMPELLELRQQTEKYQRETLELNKNVATLSKYKKNTEELIKNLQEKNNFSHKEISRWQNRALAGRDMYKMMKQLRELSDTKLELYQESVIKICDYVLHSLKKELPTINTGDVAADKWLADTLNALAERNPPMQHTLTDENSSFII